jgi:hypothetical protein
MRRPVRLAAWALVFLFAWCDVSAIPQDKPSSTTASNSVPAKGAPSAAEITAAKTSGKVWVNMDSGVYHKGGRWYGKTKNGKFMSPDEAKKAGYKAAKRD